MTSHSLDLIKTWLLAGFLALVSVHGVEAQQAAQWNYSFVGNNAQALYPGQVAIPQLGTTPCLGTTAGLLSSGSCGNSNVASLAALEALPTSNGALAYLSSGGRSGWFQFTTANRSALVTADPQQGVNVAPSSDPTGASGAWVRQFTGGLSQYWFGVIANGTADDTADLNAVFSYALASGVPCKFAPGESLVTSTLTVSTNCDMSAAEIITDGSLSVYNSYPFAVMVVGSSTSGAVIGPINVSLPNIVNYTHTVGDGWTNTTNSIGVALINLNYSNVVTNNIFGFGNGVGIGGFGEGTSYDTVTLGSVISNKNGVIFQAFDTTGWSNQNTVIGGKISYDTGETTPGTRNLSFFLYTGSSNNPDGNTVVGTSLEGNSAVAVEFASAVDNTLVGVRFETTSPLAYNTGASPGNMLIGGYKPNLTFSNSGTFSTLMLDQNGQYLPGPVVLGSPGVTTNPQILTGTGVPSTSLGTIGSIYLNLSGGTSTTLYVKTASSVWTAK